MPTQRSRTRTSADLRAEYDFAAIRGGVRGKTFRRASTGTNLVLLDPDATRTFRESRTVNQALRLLANVARETAGTTRSSCAKRG